MEGVSFCRGIHKIAKGNVYEGVNEGKGFNGKEACKK
jgi:hypothetical protein